MSGTTLALRNLEHPIVQVGYGDPRLHIDAWVASGKARRDWIAFHNDCSWEPPLKAVAARTTMRGHRIVTFENEHITVEIRCLKEDES